jgi:hypothetical protein
VHELSPDNEFVSYRIRRNARARRIILRVDRGQVVVTAPPRAAVAEIAVFVAGHREWLRGAIARARADLAPPLVIGDQIPLLNSWLVLEAGPVRSARRREDRLVIARGAPLDAQVERWYRGVARKHFMQLMDLWAPRIGVAPTGFAVRGQRSRWGSASARGTISINWRLVMAPPEVASYVMVHELVHLVDMNHSPAFWARVAAHWPGYRAERDWLHAHGARLLSGPHARAADAGDVRAVG